MKHKNLTRKITAAIYMALTYSLVGTGCAMQAQAPDIVSSTFTPTSANPPQSPSQPDSASMVLPPDQEARPAMTQMPNPKSTTLAADSEICPATTFPSSPEISPTPTPDPKAYLTPLPDGGYTIAEEFTEQLNYTNTNSYPKLFARYQGQLCGFHPYMVPPEYIIDLIETGTYELPMIARIQINLFFPFETKQQVFTIPLEGGCYNLQDGLWITDFNKDGIDDFIVDFGCPLAEPSSRAAFFLYDQKNDCYKNLGILYDATFYEEEGVIYEFHYTEADHWKKDIKPSIVRSKYIIQDDSLVLMERLSETFPYYSDSPDSLFFPGYPRRSPFPSFTLRKHIDEELKLIYSNVPEKKN